MTRCFTACLIALSLGAGLSAQYPEQKPADKQMPSKSPQTVTIAGCVREGDTPNSFFLANVDPAALAAQHGTAATGTSGMPPAPAGGGATAPSTTTVLLISTADIDLSKHVGHKVEVTGMIAPTKGDPAKPGTGAAGTSGTPTTDTTARAAEKDTDKKAHAHKLTVRSVKHISEACSM